MTARLIAALLLTAAGLAAQAFRVDPFVYTVSGTAPIGSSTQVLTLPGASIQVCSDATCANLATTYTSATGATPCPANAQVTLADSNVCQATSGDQGDFGFWVTPGTYYYSVTLANGNFIGPFPVSAGTPSSSVSTVTGGTGIFASPTSGAVVVTNTGVVSFKGRTGAVIAITGDYTYAQIGGAVQGSTTKPQMAGVNSNSPGAPLCDDASGNATTSGCLQVTSFNSRTGVVVPAVNDYTYALIGGAKQGNTNKPQMAGTNSGTLGATLCNDAAGNATTAGCSGGGGSGVSSFNSRTGAVVPAYADYTYTLIAGPVQGSTTKPQMAGTNSGTLGDLLCNDAFGNATTSGCAGGGGGISTVLGTSQQITVNTVGSTATISLPTTVATTTFSCLGAGATICYASPHLLIDGAGNLTTSTGAGGANIIAAGYVTSSVWYGMLPSPSTPSTTPGGGYAALTYKGGVSGLEIWIYDTVHTAWSAVDLAGVAGGLTSINGQTGAAQTIAVGTSLSLVTTTNTQTLNAIQDIRTSATPTFTGIVSNGAFNSTVTGATTAFTANGGTFIVSGAGDINSATFANTNGYKIGSTTVIDASRNASFVNLTISGTCTGCTASGVSSITGTANQVIASSPTGAVTLSLPQSIATTSSPTFGNVTVNGAFNANVSGATTAFTTGGGSFIINGQGDVSSPGGANFVGGTGVGAYRVGGTVIVDSSRQATFTNVTNSGAFNSTVTGASTAYTANGGTFIVTGAGDVNSATFVNTNGYKIGAVFIVDSSKNATFNNLTVNGSTITGVVGTSNTGSPTYTMNASYKISSSGNFYDRVPGVSGAISCAGIADGWGAYTTDNYLVRCNGFGRYRISLAAY